MMLFLGIVCFGLAAASGIYVDRQRFYRRNGAGVEEFATYGKKVKARIDEGALLALGTISGVAGMCLTAAGIYYW